MATVIQIKSTHCNSSTSLCTHENKLFCFLCKTSKSILPSWSLMWIEMTKRTNSLWLWNKCEDVGTHLTHESFGKPQTGNEFTETTSTVWHNVRTEFITAENKSNTSVVWFFGGFFSLLFWIYYCKIYMQHLANKPNHFKTGGEKNAHLGTFVFADFFMATFSLAWKSKKNIFFFKCVNVGAYFVWGAYSIEKDKRFSLQGWRRFVLVRTQP